MKTGPLYSITPIGGVEQIGSNLTLVESENSAFIIDIGILFPHEDLFDINYLIPDLSGLPDSVTDLVVTHGHEDHIGAISHIIDRFPEITIWAPPFAASLIQRKLASLKKSNPLNIYKENDLIEIAPFSIHPIHVNHSIPDTFGLLAIHHSKQSCFFFVSDFKIDNKTKYEKPFNFEKLIQLSANIPQRILFADSTNIYSSSQETPSEEDLIPVFDEIFSKAEGRIYITCFASNVHRLITFAHLAKKHKRWLVPHGRSMRNYIETAKQHDLFYGIDDVIKDDDSGFAKNKKTVVLLSGCQGDFLGTFRRVCLGEDATFKIEDDDTLIVSSKPIPGSERKIGALLNKVSETCAKIYSSPGSFVHVSGHPGKTDLLNLYQRFLPNVIVPIHGETYFLKEHLSFVKAQFSSAEAIYIQNYDRLTIGRNSELSITKLEKLDPLFIHGNGIPIEKERISERRKLAQSGVVFVSLKTQKSSFEIENISFMGLPSFINSEDEHLATFLESLPSSISERDLTKLKEEVRIKLRRYFESRLGYRPIAIVH